MNDSQKCIFVLDRDLNVISSSNSFNDCGCWHDTLIFKDNRLIGISGLRDSKFQGNILNGASGRKTILLKAKEKGDEASRLLLKITPLFSPSQDSNSSYSCLEIQTLDTFYTSAAKRVADKFNLTNAETVVLKYLMMGLSSHEIKEKMMIGTPTLRTHQQRLRQKTGENSSIKTILAALNPENHADDLIEFDDP